MRLRLPSTCGVLLLLVCCWRAHGQQCSANYSEKGPPLLFGGVSSRCLQGCKSRKAVQPNDWYAKHSIIGDDFDASMT